MHVMKTLIQKLYNVVYILIILVYTYVCNWEICGVFKNVIFFNFLLNIFNFLNKIYFIIIEI